MADPLSIASGIAGLVTLSSAVLAAGYQYLESVLSAPDDLRNLVRETAALNVVLSQLITHSLSEQSAHQSVSQKLLQQGVIQECEQTLYQIQLLLREFEPTRERRGKNIVKTILWPLKKKEIIRHRDRLSRFCANLHTAVSVESASTLRTLEREQQWSNNIVKRLSQNANEVQEQKLLDWLSVLNPSMKHAAISCQKQPGTGEWLLQEQTFLNWVDHGRAFWLQGTCGTGKTVLMYALGTRRSYLMAANVTKFECDQLHTWLSPIPNWVLGIDLSLLRLCQSAHLRSLSDFGFSYTSTRSTNGQHTIRNPELVPKALSVLSTA